MRIAICIASIFAIAAHVFFGSTTAWADPKPIDVGKGITVPVDPAQPLKLAYFAPSENSFLQANLESLRETAAKVGAEIQFFDSGWSATNEYNQIQNAIQSGRFNAFLVQPLDGQLLCKILSEDAPKAGILVSITVVQLCNRGTLSGDQQWAPGTLNFVGGQQSYDSYKLWIDHIVKLNPGKHKIGVLSGPDLVPNAVNMEKALKEAQAANPDFQIVGIWRTDYSPPQGLQKTQNMIQSHPDIDIILVVYSTITRGAVAALKNAGKSPGEIKIYDFGGTIWAKQAIKDGWIELTFPQYARSIIRAAVESLAAAHAGNPGPHFVPRDGVPEKQAGIVDKSNVDAFNPESD